MLEQWEVTARIAYLLFCPDAPGLEFHEQHLGALDCPGHPYRVDLRMFIKAPDEARAQWAALKKWSATYAWPQYIEEPAVRRIKPDPKAPPAGQEVLPGLDEEREPAAVILSYRGRSAVLDHPGQVLS